MDLEKKKIKKHIEGIENFKGFKGQYDVGFVDSKTLSVRDIPPSRCLTTNLSKCNNKIAPLEQATAYKPKKVSMRQTFDKPSIYDTDTFNKANAINQFINKQKTPEEGNNKPK